MQNALTVIRITSEQGIKNWLDSFLAAKPAQFFWDGISVLRSDTDAVTTTEAPVSEKRVGKGGGARCPSFFLVAFARKNDSSLFSLFSSLPPCYAIFRFHAFGYRVEIENCTSLDSVQKKREADDNFKFMRYVI